ncbi:MAG: hypothetical protein ACYSUI_01695 [Planctomycetota bacterium]
MRSLVPALVVFLPVMSGCERPTCEVRVLRPEIHWSDITTTSIDLAEAGFVNLATEGTDGAFPTSLAVARVTVDAVPDGGNGRTLVMAMTPPNDFLPWNALFDNLRYVSEVFPLHTHDLGEDAPAAGPIVSAAGELTAGMCLLYAESDLSENESEVSGVLYRTGKGTPLAAIRARAAVPDPEALPHPPEHVEDDLRHCDPRVLAEQRFERLVLECVRDLHAHDRLVVSQPPAGWTPQPPLMPRHWPPLPLDKPR